MDKTRLDFRFDGLKLRGTSRHTKVEISVQDWTEIGVEICFNDPLQQTFWLVINRLTHNLRIPSDSPVFKPLLDHFTCFDGFDWTPIVKARMNPSQTYSVCWLRAALPANPFSAAA